MANVCCSIETEPRTLNQGQINHVREMAADVAQKVDTREASAAMFNELQGLGLISGTEIKEVDEPRTIGSENEVGLGVEKPVEYCNQLAQKAQSNIVERPCQCSCNDVVNIESPDPNNIIVVKEPVTAPF